MSTPEQYDMWMLTALLNGDFQRYIEYRAKRDELRSRLPRCLMCGEDLSALVAELGSGEAAFDAHCADAH
jgi:hypothetical protein